MNAFLFLIPVSLLMGCAGLWAFLWCMKTEQYDDLAGAAHRVLLSEDEPLDRPS